MSNHVLFELNRWRPILLYWCALWQVMMRVGGWMIWQQNKTSNALPLLLVRIPKILTNNIWAFVVLWNVYFRCSLSCVSWLPVATCLPCALALTLLCILITCGHLRTLCFGFNSPVYFGDLWPLAYPVLCLLTLLCISVTFGHLATFCLSTSLR